MKTNSEQYYILLISVHGLIRANDLELGRDADTGGQTKYVVELARALASLPQVAQVDLLTRKISEPDLSGDYGQDFEVISSKERIVRIECAESRYMPKEHLWDYLDSFADNCLAWLHNQERLPDIVHSHYADAGYVGALIAKQLGMPLIHTGHSLGRSKRKRLLASGLKQEEIEQRYNMSRRIEAEEQTLGVAERVITSTHQEIVEQYGMYDYYLPDQMRVIAPGTDLKKFYPPPGNDRDSAVYRDLCRFLRDPDKPVILALSRPDQRKNIHTLIEAYGESQTLQNMANLIIVAGNRDDIRDMDSGIQEVLSNILFTIDQYDLYGVLAFPKHHSADDVPQFYRLAALSRGVFVNPALTEPFGLTLIEAAASGLPILSTEDGGPKDIIKNCQNGLLVDPLNKQEIINRLVELLDNAEEWDSFSKNGVLGVKKHYSWPAHAKKYLAVIKPIIDKSEPLVRMSLKRRPMLYHDRGILTDLDQNLLGDLNSLQEFIRVIKENKQCTTFGIATGRRLDSALSLLRKNRIPLPDVLITSLGTEIYYMPDLTRDIAWAEHIDHLWNRNRLRHILKDLPGLKLQEKSEQSAFKLSYYYDAEKAPDINDINHLLLQNDQTVNVVLAFGQFLDIVPIRASKGLALRWFTEQWNIPLEHILAAGGSGADEDMMRGNMLSVVVANRHHEELSELTDIERIFFASKPFSAGIVEALQHYDFFRACDLHS
ncbi:MAG: HAD-IIB family hydrolase [Gammaproteobacteria bacterium]|nr:HAD-IIB family hydrolase [Gammaproteobacteria bacterium]